MKKLFAVLFCALVTVGTAFAEELSYEIDSVATAKAPWTVGEIIIKDGECVGQKYYREFLGIASSGLALVQDFYLSGEKLLSPFLTRVTDADRSDKAPCGIGEDGVYIKWYKNGGKKSAMNFKNGQREGSAILWYENGQKQYEINYKDDELEGLATLWYENGQMQSVGIFENGKAKGIATQWYENGQKQSEINFKDDELLSGSSSWWYENGQKQWESNFENGKEISSRAWDEKGNLIEEKDYGTPEH